MNKVPRHIFLDINLTCNLKCVQCDIWKLKNPDLELTIDERKRVIEQIGQWDKSIRLVITGGEQFLRRKYLYEIAETCKRNSVYNTISSNGTIIKEEDFNYLPDSGINCIVLSIDSHLPEIHDKIRGVKGTHDRVVKATKRLVIEMKKSKTNFSILVSVILGRHNINYIREMVQFIEDLGVDTILFQPIQPNFAATVPNKWWETNLLFPKNAHDINTGIDSLIELKKSGRRLFQQLYQFEDMRSYFLLPDQPHKERCNSMNENMMIDMFGNVRLCFNMERIGLKPIGSVKETPIKDLWENSYPVNQKMIGCVESCGTMVCHCR